MERAIQYTGRTSFSVWPRLSMLWRWGVIVLGVVLLVGVNKSGRTFASLVTESRGWSQVQSTPALISLTMYVGSATQDFAFRELELLRSIELGEVAQAETLLIAGVSANVKDQRGWTPLMLAALHNRITLIPVLSANGADPNAHTVKGTTAVMLAASNGHKEMVRLLLEHGAQVNAKTTGGWTALMYAAWKGHSVIVSELLQAAADPTVTDSQSWTALMYAAWQGHAATVEVLLGSQERHVQRESKRQQARALALSQGHMAIVHSLDEKEKRR